LAAVLPSLWGGSLGLLVVGLGMAVVLRSQIAAVGRGLNSVLDHKAQWLASVIREVVASHRVEIADQTNMLKAHLDGTVARHETTLRDLQEQTAEKLGQLNLRLGNAREEFSSLIRDYARELSGERLEPELDRTTSRQLVQGLQQLRESLSAELERLRQGLDARPQGPNQREAAFWRLFWPPLFQNGPLAPWRERITERGLQNDPAAMALVLALGRYASASRDAGDLRQTAEALHAVSLGAYGFWRHNGTKVLEASQEWKSAFQSALDASHTPLDIILVLEGERFDMNCMLATNQDPANRILVREVLSWIIRDKSSPTPKVLCHGRVITG
jgi:hypothetical protein